MATKKLAFKKMHGLGNDFVFLNTVTNRIPDVGSLAKKLLDRRFGIGADQLLVVGKPKSKDADFRMDIFNPDGSQVGMCGNGLRCVARYVVDEKLTRKKDIAIETLSGIQSVRLKGKDTIEVDMGEPILKAKDIPVRLSGRVINRPLRVRGKEFRVTCVSMGNPHCVLFVDDVQKAQVAEIGALIENNNTFPERTNVEFVKVLSDHELQMRVWERGAGETLACGSGACAVAVAGFLNGLSGRQVTVSLPGGLLEIHWSKDNNHVYMTGSATSVFEGEITL